MQGTDNPYLIGNAQSAHTIPVHESVAMERHNEELSGRRVLFHVMLLAITFVTATLTGAAFSVTSQTEPTSFIGVFLGPFASVFDQTVAGSLAPLANGVIFTFTLLTILGAHEFGHYFACRHYKIRATLPYFIPAPPLLTPFGTFGAVIRIKEPITTRRALFDIGIAGPLAGFVLALPASVIGLVLATEVAPIGEGMQFHDPVLFIIIIEVLSLPKWIEWNPIYWAAWGSVLVTALNLFPVGQLDGGHILYAVVGPRAHKLVSRLTCLAVAVLAVASLLLHSSPVWLIWTIVLLFLLRAGHPPVVQEEPLGRGRLILAVVAAVVFLLCFMPFPITVS